ncbi:hypothetical protein Hypma_007741 [Hypsizygus marmoreus]|uniref:Uncharacterized protein n=1 Tax=Hypsizygus marmoreus TaxID=39966 RepID=A0A369JVZ9_HYPMA|nr:hypothetical protein Hypma_007741 [Hypsizygus marmoreus]
MDDVDRLLDASIDDPSKTYSFVRTVLFSACLLWLVSVFRLNLEPSFRFLRSDTSVTTSAKLNTNIYVLHHCAAEKLEIRLEECFISICTIFEQQSNLIRCGEISRVVKVISFQDPMARPVIGATKVVVTLPSDPADRHLPAGHLPSRWWIGRRYPIHVFSESDGLSLLFESDDLSFVFLALVASSSFGWLCAGIARHSFILNPSLGQPLLLAAMPTLCYELESAMTSGTLTAGLKVCCYRRFLRMRNYGSWRIAYGMFTAYHCQLMIFTSFLLSGLYQDSNGRPRWLDVCPPVDPPWAAPAIVRDAANEVDSGELAICFGDMHLSYVSVEDGRPSSDMFCSSSTLDLSLIPSS